MHHTRGIKFRSKIDLYLDGEYFFDPLSMNMFTQDKYELQKISFKSSQRTNSNFKNNVLTPKVFMMCVSQL
jgi:hypothetical protein